MDSKGNVGRYDQPDEFAHVFSWANSDAEAEVIAKAANDAGVESTRRGKFVPGSFRAQRIPGRVPAVVGTLTGDSRG